MLGVLSENISKSGKDASPDSLHWLDDCIEFSFVTLLLESFALQDKIFKVRVEILVALFTEVLGLTHESLDNNLKELFSCILSSF